MSSAPEFRPPPYSAFAGYPNIADGYHMPRNLSEIGGQGDEQSDNHSRYFKAQLNTFEDDWPLFPDPINTHWDCYFSSDWVLYPDSLESAELPDSATSTATCIALDSERLSNEQDEMTHPCVVLSNCCSLEEAQAILDGYSRTRQLEAQDGKKKRSANSFFLYRIAFRNVAEQVWNQISAAHIESLWVELAERNGECETTFPESS